MKKGVKIQAGALQFVVFTGVIIALLLTAFIALTYTHSFFKKQSYAAVATVKNADFGIQYALSSDTYLNDSITIAPFEDQHQLKFRKAYWGVFEKVHATARHKNKQFTKIALVGGQLSLKDRPALYVKDQDKPLIVVGDTKIEGTAFLPEKAVRPGTISGKAYYGSHLIYGTIKKSDRQLPLLPAALMTQLHVLTQQEFSFGTDALITPEYQKPLANSFTKPVNYIYSPGILDLTGLKITGNVIVYAEEKIIVTAASRLSDVILTAPEIEIKDGVTGNFQAIASRKIHVGKNSRLDYPSALVIRETAPVEVSHQKEEHQILIDEHAIVKGVVLFLSGEKKNNTSAQLVLEPHAAVYGELYCNQNTALKGMVHGSVYTSNFIVHESGTIYQNHLFNGMISGKHLTEAYTGIPWGIAKKEIVKWLY